MPLPPLHSWWSDRIKAMRRDKLRTALQGVAYLLAIAWLDYATGYEINLTVVYVTPLIMLTVAGGWRVGVATAFACALSVEFTDWLAGRRYDQWAFHAYSFISHSLSYLSFLLLIVQLLNLWDRERAMAGQDQLTGLHNRHGFLGLAEERLHAWAREKQPAVMTVWNLARLREVNAQFGHDKADALLLSAADALRDALPDAVVGRTGSDRFAALSTARELGNLHERLHAVEEALARAARHVGVPLALRNAHLPLPPRRLTPDEVAKRLDELLDRVG
ncbi:hypothetical protein NNJEOMEG_01626 [Fundidesulfovibrio magnetotacticus]|uniref:GGDEF domain-containing protein n=1 Tax=Fundidesulfovibrio magnetotacticus TaxID=2730080 RepID=A0A6V8LM91_9BACT|nr:diguanylate cyclase [Fundidesulfovibrio magnetotacticus]GFK93792.1 hypothetical protein NNJEOMEG_01626 [Fundidesulfovibrio magnetotacticus]